MIGSRWGVTEAETRKRFACDDLVGSPRARGVARAHGRRTTGENGTRLLHRVVMDTSPELARLLSVGDLVMARRQLPNLKARAEAVAAAS